ncbi:hypothetical protein [Asticcacaulis sp.]|uniref:hypothetical protein n=1 Tax=Asticcacaulis sp. TaxID=1872648 RepID=UPI003F7CBA76
MTGSKWKFAGGVAVAALIGGLLGGFNLSWSREASFPLYGLIIDICALPVLIMLILYVRKLKAATTDEFSIAKKRYAAQSGFVIGFVLFLITGLFPIFLPDLYRQFIASMDGANDGFLIGRVSGMAPFVLGLLIGQVNAWLKYR